ncbi:MAG: GUN4 domain-containing protein [Leptolyngbyaceae cyanobacterium bins.59]|nr:GUN4 domain-containing protein [Leptolyngbyaceae cyanobacterium bins.59]
MTDSPNQPKRYDVVLGGQSPMPLQGLVLGGLEGVQQRLRSRDPEHRAAALQEALNHGLVGLDMVIRALKDESPLVQRTAFLLLRDRTETKVRQALDLYTPSGSHYKNLAGLLAAKRWREADWATRVALGEACGLVQGDQIQARHIPQIPCEDLLLIDRLWRRYSRNRFGFSIQRNRWQQIYERYWDLSEIWEMFGNSVGWRKNLYVVESRWKRYHELTFNLEAPLGHLPHMGFGITTVAAFSDRLGECQNS